MPLPDAMEGTAVLVDTNVIIEAVRTRCWNAVTGALRTETVTECRDESMRGDRHRSGYVVVTDQDRGRLAAVHGVDDVQRAVFALGYPDAQNLDAGERDLFAHAFARAAGGDDAWILSSPDKAAVRAAVALGWTDRIHALAALVSATGARPDPPLAEHFGERWLSEFRTACLLGR